MSINLTLKNIPDEFMNGLRERAKRNHRSLQGEIMAILEEAMQPGQLKVEDLYAQVRRMGLVTPEEATRMIRAERDGRQSC